MKPHTWAPSPEAARAYPGHRVTVRPCVGVDPGETGGAALVLPDGVVAWVAWWRVVDAHRTELAVLSPGPGAVVNSTHPHLPAALAALPEVPPRAHVTVERVVHYPGIQAFEVLAEAAGMTMSWARLRGLVPTFRPLASRWRSDMLKPPARESSAGLDARLKAAILGTPPSSGRHIVAGLTGQLSAVKADGWDAVALACWGGGARLTEAD